MAKISPTQNSLKKVRKEGYIAGVVEKWVMGADIRRDLFGFIDILAINKEGGDTLAIQCTSYSNIASHIKKIEADELAVNLAAVRKAGWRIEVHGWHKVKNRWQVRVVDLS